MDDRDSGSDDEDMKTNKRILLAPILVDSNEYSQQPPDTVPQNEKQKIADNTRTQLYLFSEKSHARTTAQTMSRPLGDGAGIVQYASATGEAMRDVRLSAPSNGVISDRKRRDEHGFKQPPNPVAVKQLQDRFKPLIEASVESLLTYDHLLERVHGLQMLNREGLRGTDLGLNDPMKAQIDEAYARFDFEDKPNDGFDPWTLLDIGMHVCDERKIAEDDKGLADAQNKRERSIQRFGAPVQIGASTSEASTSSGPRASLPARDDDRILWALSDMNLQLQHLRGEREREREQERERMLPPVFGDSTRATKSAEVRETRRRDVSPVVAWPRAAATEAVLAPEVPKVAVMQERVVAQEIATAVDTVHAPPKVAITADLVGNNSGIQPLRPQPAPIVVKVICEKELHEDMHVWIPRLKYWPNSKLADDDVAVTHYRGILYEYLPERKSWLIAYYPLQVGGDGKRFVFKTSNEYDLRDSIVKNAFKASTLIDCLVEPMSQTVYHKQLVEMVRR